MAQNHLQGSSLFSKTSAFHGAGVEPPMDFDVVGVIPSDEQQKKIQTPGPKITVEIHKKQIDDWVYRLQNCANEAGDEHLLALESDILDLREELDHLLD